jgi:hypothetical protein
MYNGVLVRVTKYYSGRTGHISRRDDTGRFGSIDRIGGHR